MSDLIDRQKAIDSTYAETVSTNPEHFKSSEKFIGFMDDIDISDFGRWQWANGFNTALVATKIQLEKLPSAESKIIHCKDCKHRDSNDCPMYYEEWIEIDEGDGYFDTDNIIHDWATDEGFCHCAELRGDSDE